MEPAASLPTAPEQAGRLSMATPSRLLFGTLSSGFVGFTLGAVQGGQMAQLRFRAEHAHKMPDSTTGWYLYHKSKNYHAMQGGLHEGLRMGGKTSFWTLLALGLESAVDDCRGSSDMFSTMIATLTVAGAFSLRPSAIPPPTFEQGTAPILPHPSLNRLSNIGIVITPEINMRPASVHQLAVLAARPDLASISPLCRGAFAFRTRRSIHSSDKKSSTLAELPGSGRPSPPYDEPQRAPLSVLPLAMVLRSLATNIVSSSPLLLPVSLRIMLALAHSSNPLLSPDRNPLLRFLLKKSFYAQFCAGENAAEVRQTVARLKGIGFTGVILGYAREVVLSDDQAAALGPGQAGRDVTEVENEAIESWARGTLETVNLADPGDFVALKFTGAGSLALHQLRHRLPPSSCLLDAINSICQRANERGVRLLFDAEQDMLQNGIDDWTMMFSRLYNRNPNSATVYGTYQAYKKCMPDVISRHLAEAQKGGFTLGVKLVRGAYLASDQRQIFHDTKAETDACYDALAASILTRRWSSIVRGSGPFPAAHLVLATHNAESVQRARTTCASGEARSGVAFAQLQGMADEISCELVQDNLASSTQVPVYKYMVWGTTGECVKYLLRRAQENRDAVERTRGGRDAMWAEVVRRFKKSFGRAR
ncbi:hypothetical protein CP533_0017 [Ophiocordyceps camponoti-saundersi (nom. inval.)]|nr:hypothetical protein CP533_0017 [Ophiocordyceps camponoti-saundersi (nom. inval.)]